MESVEPFINVLTLLTVLSVLSERATNLVKLRSPVMREKKLTPEEEKAREYAITGRGMLMGIAVAVVMKADLFAVLGRMDAPWETLGWVHVENYKWMRSAASASAAGAAYALAGCVLTGVALGFGSKFWHDILGAVYEVRDLARRRNNPPPAAPPAPAPAPPQP